MEVNPLYFLWIYFLTDGDKKHKNIINKNIVLTWQKISTEYQLITLISSKAR